MFVTKFKTRYCQGKLLLSEEKELKLHDKPLPSEMYFAWTHKEPDAVPKPILVLLMSHICNSEDWELCDG